MTAVFLENNPGYPTSIKVETTETPEGTTESNIVVTSVRSLQQQDQDSDSTIECVNLSDDSDTHRGEEGETGDRS